MTTRASRPGPLRMLLVGAGAMGRTWIQAIAANPDTALVGIVDLLPAAAIAAGDLYRHLAGDLVPTGNSLATLAESTRPDAVIDVTVPQAHHAVTVQALRLGLPVLGEKPAAGTLSKALSLAATSECTGGLFMVSQSRRYDPRFTQLRQLVTSLAPVALITHTFARAPHFGGFRDQMDDPLLVDMAIHPFDAARALVGRDPLAVYGESFNPPWSWYHGDAAATAIFEFEGGSRFVYSGSWCSGGAETSWNGHWSVSAAGGTAHWDGDNAPEGMATDGVELSVEPADTLPRGVAGALADFVAAVRYRTRPQGEIHENVVSLAMVEAAVRSAKTRRRISLAELLGEAWRTAIDEEHDEEVRRRLRSWTSPIGAPSPASPETAVSHDTGPG